ncbi:MAG: thioesterase family protein [Myxococcales bacterium]|nr:thioesterase family protein [Myxococcales bacterium]
MMAMALQAVRRTVVEAEPVTVTAHFLRPTPPGAVDIDVDVVKAGRQFTASEARLRAGDRECLRMLVTSGRLPAQPSILRLDREPPAHGPQAFAPLEVVDALPEITRRFEQRPDPTCLGWMRGEQSEHARMRAWLRFADGRAPDVPSLVLFADAMPPPVFHWVSPGWVPTLELTVHVRARPRSTWLWCDFRTHLVANGLLEEDGEIWDETGTLVAMSRQLAALPQNSLR